MDNMIHKIAQRYLPSTHQDYDDLVQAGRIGVLLAEREFDASRGMKRSSYAYLRIRWEILAELARLKGLRRQDFEAGYPCPMTLDVGDLEAWEANTPPLLSQDAIVDDYLRILTPHQRLAIWAWLEMDTYRGAAERTGVCRQRIMQHVHAGIERLRRWVTP